MTTRKPEVEDLTDKAWGEIVEVAEAIWALVREPGERTTEGDFLRMTAAAAISLNRNDVARACAAIGNFELGLREDM